MFIMLFCSFAYGEEFTMICEGERTVRSFSNSELNDLDFESVLLKIKKNSMEYIGLNSGRSYVFSNKVYTAPKRPPHEDIKIKVLYEFTQKTIKASQIITDIGNSEESSISRFSLNIDRLTGKLSEIESISNKKTLQKSISNNFQAICKREDKLY
jgi:hypothetical protein